MNRKMVEYCFGFTPLNESESEKIKERIRQIFFNVNINRTHLCIKPIVMKSNKHNSMSFASKSVNHPSEQLTTVSSEQLTTVSSEQLTTVSSEQLTTVSYEEACITDYRDEQLDILHDPEDDNLYDPRGRFFPSVDGFDDEEDIEF